VVVVDSMRFDIWRGVLRPAFERDYEIEEARKSRTGTL
jgi:hypothetical protein